MTKYVNMSSYAVTGANRGIGFELTKQLANQPHSKVSRVYALSRGQAAKALSNLISQQNGRVVFVSCDVTDADNINAAVRDIESKSDGTGLDVLINNAGTQDWVDGGILNLKAKVLADVFNTNVISAHLATSAFVPLLRNGKEKKVVNVSTPLGSFAKFPNFAQVPVPSYKITKAGLNMLTKQYALDLDKEGFTVLALSPGWLKTDLGSQYADLEVEVGVTATLKIILEADRSFNGKFQNIHVPGWENAEGPNQYDGKEMPW